MESKHRKLEEFERLCRRHRLPLTVQRRLIMEALVERDDHPTADQIFEQVGARVPGLSRTTVYRVLETLVRVGVAVKASHPGAATRFDPKTERHHHLVCIHCDKMVDLEDRALDRLPAPVALPPGFEATDYSIYFRGSCPDCRRKISQGYREKDKSEFRTRRKRI